MLLEAGEGKTLSVEILEVFVFKSFMLEMPSANALEIVP